MDYNKMIEHAAKAMNCKPSDILDFKPIKAGMTNVSYAFKLKNKKYIYRIPGAGAEGLVNRQNEYDAYKAIRWLDISDKVVYYDKKTGVKISEFIENARNADGMKMKEAIRCLLFAKHELHDKNKTVNSKINIVDMINNYERLMGKSKYPDYQKVKEKVLSNLRYWKKQPHKYCLCHFDLNPDNFLILKSGRIKLLDWEYAGMNDPIFDLAGWIVYKQYDIVHIYTLIAGYLEHEPSEQELKKVYAYIAAMGLLWSNWCEYKRKCGEEFGEYAEQQFAYARKFSDK